MLTKELIKIGVTYSDLTLTPVCGGVLGKKTSNLYFAMISHLAMQFCLHRECVVILCAVHSSILSAVTPVPKAASLDKIQLSLVA